jgi:chemotaxis protein CheX
MYGLSDRSAQAEGSVVRGKKRLPLKSRRFFVIDQDLLTESVKDATHEVFATMLGIEPRYEGFAPETRAPELGIISLVGITGDWGGSGVFCCSPALARLLCTRMLGTEPTAIDDEVLDVIAEITNMMIGNVKTALEGAAGPLAISVPTVIHGRNFDFRNAPGLRSLALAFTAEEHAFEVRISLAPTANNEKSRSRVAVLNLAHF